jgi:hypothetical protein
MIYLSRCPTRKINFSAISLDGLSNQKPRLKSPNRGYQFHINNEHAELGNGVVVTALRKRDQ